MMLEVNGSCEYPDSAFCCVGQNFIKDMETCPMAMGAEGCVSNCLAYKELRTSVEMVVNGRCSCCGNKLEEGRLFVCRECQKKNEGDLGENIRRYVLREKLGQKIAQAILEDKEEEDGIHSEGEA